MPESLDVYSLIDRHAGVLLDAYGVLVNRAGTLPGATAFIAHLNATGKPYAVLTNAASRRTEALQAFFAELGLTIPRPRLISSASLVPAHFHTFALAGSRTCVLGPPDSAQFARDGGARLVAPTDTAEAEVVLIADQGGYDFLPSLDAVLNRVLRRIDRGDWVHLVCCNPDLIYPTTDRDFGFTAGAVAALFERVLHERYGAHAPRFHYLGKPYAPIFAAGQACCGGEDLVMIGDQPATDIAGARRFGIASALISTGLGRAAPLSPAQTPDYHLRDLLPA